MNDNHHEDVAITKRNSFPLLRQLYAVSGIILYTISTGCIIGYPAVLLPQLHLPESTIQTTPHSESWIASVVGFAILNGILLVPYMMDRLGRKLMNFLSVLPALAGWGFILIADSIPLLIFARYLHGFAMGLQGPLASVTIGEYTTPVHRGGFLGSIALSLATGMLLCHSFGSVWTWKTTALASSSFHMLSLIIIATSPESPAWLASKGKFEKCRHAFFWLRGEGDADRRELEIMISNQIINRKMKQKRSKESFKVWLKRLIEILSKKEFYKPLFIMMLMFILMQFSGSNVIPTYSVDIMKAITGDSVSPYIGMLTVDVVRFIAAILSIFALREFNRRSVLFFSSITSTVALSITAAYLYFRDIGYITLEHNWIPIAFMLLYVFCLTAGIYTMPWAILGEIFPLAFKGMGSGLSGVFLSTMFFAVIKSSPYMFISIGVHGAFAVFTGVIVVCSVILYFVLPETKGKTLQEIEDYFKGDPNGHIDFIEDNKMLNNEQKETA